VTFEYGKFVPILDPEGNKIESPRANSPLLAAESESIKFTLGDRIPTLSGFVACCEELQFREPDNIEFENLVK
jgi:hypothetical protein